MRSWRSGISRWSGGRLGTPRVESLLFGTLVLLATATSPSPASAQAPTFPADWNGDWEIEIRYTHAGEMDPHLIETVTDSICAGEDLGLEPFANLVDCSLQTIDATSVELSCTGQAAAAGCSAQGSLDLDIARTGDSLAGSGAFQSQLTGNCPGPALDELVAIVGMRVAVVPTDCGPPAGSFADRFIFLPDLASLEVLAQGMPSVPALSAGALVALASAMGVVARRRLRRSDNPRELGPS